MNNDVGRFAWSFGGTSTNDRSICANTVLNWLMRSGCLTLEDCDHDEQRFVTMGRDALGRVLVVAYAYQEPDTLRLISARKAEPHERRQYEG